MNTKQKIIEVLEEKRVGIVWELIEKAVREIYEEGKKADLTQAKEEYLENEEQINQKENRWIVLEHYNIEDGFYCRFYEDGVRFDTGKPDFEGMFDDYFSDTDKNTWRYGEGEEILMVDMKEMKCYLIGREVKYNKQKIEIK